LNKNINNYYITGNLTVSNFIWITGHIEVFLVCQQRYAVLAHTGKWLNYVTGSLLS